MFEKAILFVFAHSKPAKSSNLYLWFSKEGHIQFTFLNCLLVHTSILALFEYWRTRPDNWTSVEGSRKSIYNRAFYGSSSHLYYLGRLPLPPLDLAHRGPVRDYWMIYRGPGFQAVVRFSSSPTIPPADVTKFDRRHTRRLRKRDNLLTEMARRVGTRSKTIRRRGSLVRYKSFYTLWALFSVFTTPFSLQNSTL